MSHRSPLRDFATRVAALATRIGLWPMYAAFRALPQQNTITLVTRLFSETSLDFRLLAAEIVRQSPDTRVVILNHRASTKLRIVGNVITQTYWLARSRAVITDSYIIPISMLPHRHSTTVIQAWHALGAIKKFGYAALDTPEGHSSVMARSMRMHRNYDWLLVGGTHMSAEFASAFDQDREKILPLGLPRVDHLLSDEAAEQTRERIAAEHPEIGDKPVVLYAPTFRTGTTVPVRSVIDAVDTDRYALVIKLHPLDQIDDEIPGVVTHSVISTTEWMFVASVVVSDYSAIMFDAAVRGIPVVVYAYDFDEYAVNRGLFINEPSLFPGPIVQDENSLAEAIENPQVDAVLTFRDRYLDRVDGSATAAIVSLALTGRPSS